MRPVLARVQQLLLLRLHLLLPPLVGVVHLVDVLVRLDQIDAQLAQRSLHRVATRRARRLAPRLAHGGAPAAALFRAASTPPSGSSHAAAAAAARRRRCSRSRRSTATAGGQRRVEACRARAACTTIAIILLATVAAAAATATTAVASLHCGVRHGIVHSVGVARHAGSASRSARRRRRGRTRRAAALPLLLRSERLSRLCPVSLSLLRDLPRCLCVRLFLFPTTLLVELPQLGRAPERLDFACPHDPSVCRVRSKLDAAGTAAGS